MIIRCCQSGLILTGAQAVELISLPDGAHEITEAVLCELQDGHTGQHAALGQTDGQQRDWWIRWATEIVVLDCCPSIAPGDDEMVCTLPDGHDGGHDFELADPRPKNPSAAALLELEGRL